MTFIKVAGPLLFLIGLISILLFMTADEDDPQAQAAAIFAAVNFIFFGFCLCVLDRMIRDDDDADHL